MRSEKQIEASRLNGAKSRGPVTPEGKRNSANTNWCRGMLARSVVLDGESRTRFDELHRSLTEELQPVTAIETMLVQKMVVAQWRQMRLWTMEKAGMEKDSANFERSSLFESRYDRQFDRALATLERLREKNPRRSQQANENNACPGSLGTQAGPAGTQPTAAATGLRQHLQDASVS
jgi:hypothetical protein